MHKNVYLFGALLIGTGMGAQAAEPPVYTVSAVPPPAPYILIYATFVNDLGHFVGRAGTETSGVRVFHSDPAKGVVVLTPPDGIELVADAGLNDADVAPFYTSAGPYTWSPVAGWKPLPSLPGMQHTRPTAINNRGEIVGYAFNGDGQNDDRSRRAVKWRTDRTIVGSQLNTESVPAAINEHREILSTNYQVTQRGLNSQGVLTMRSGQREKLGDLPANGLGTVSTAVGLAENGFAAVNGPDAADQFVACYWTEETGVVSLQLGMSEAVGMSRRGVIAGNTYAYGFAWKKQWGAINLLDHLAKGSPEVGFISVYGISGSGNIAGAGTVNGITNAVVLTPDRP